MEVRSVGGKMINERAVSRSVDETGGRIGRRHGSESDLRGRRTERRAINGSGSGDGRAQKATSAVARDARTSTVLGHSGFMKRA